MLKYKKPKGKKKSKKHYFVLRVVRAPYPSGNWCPRYAIIYDETGKVVLEATTNSYPVAACNAIHYLRETLKVGWDQITDLGGGELELTKNEFKRFLQ